MAFGDLIQTAAAQSGGSTTLTATFTTANITEGNIIVAAAASDDSALFSSVPTGYDSVASIATAINSTEWFIRVAGAGESSVLTFNWSTGSNEKSIVAIEYEGQWEGQSSVLAQSATDTGAPSSIVTGHVTGDIVTTQSSVLLVAGFTLQDPNGNSAVATQFADSSAGNTYTVGAWNRAGTALGDCLTAVVHRVVGATGTYNSSWDWAGDNSRVQNIMFALRKDEGGAPAPTPVRRHFTLLGAGR